MRSARWRRWPPARFRVTADRPACSWRSRTIILRTYWELAERMGFCMSHASWQAQYPFDSRWLQLPAGRLHYLDEGQGEPLLMSHGNPTWSFYWRRLILAFRDRFRVVVPDHLGCGLSDKPQRYRLHAAKPHRQPGAAH